MHHRLLLITPPFTQLNTPYPATAYIKGFLNTQGIDSDQMDLGIETILSVFSSSGLNNLFGSCQISESKVSQNAYRIYSLREQYIESIDSVVSFLQNSDPTLAHLICQRHFLPEASKFDHLEELEWAFGSMGIRDQARHLATLYLEDIGDFIQEVIDPHFGFSRYAERLGVSARIFDSLHMALSESNSYVSEAMLELLKQRVDAYKPTLVCFSIPFPGNLFAALKSAQWIKKHRPQIKIAIGGGYPNTELRSISDPRVFEFIDFISLDDGEAPLINLLDFLSDRIPAEMMKRTFMLRDEKVVYCNGSLHADIKQEKVGTPDYDGLPLKKYLSVIQLTNPMHRLWSDGRWNKLTMAHGCYWGKCTFCDISLDYIKNYEASSAELIVSRMEEMVEKTGERGFHFVDEAAPPALMKAVALEIIKRKLIVTWWTNIRFEKSFHLDLCRLLAASGCIAVSGGLEVASDRLLTLIAKGVSVAQVAQVNRNFIEAGIMVHAYLMYGFPTQTAQETIDSLEVVRQMFEQGILQSAFWHRFAMTAHSPVGTSPSTFKVESADDRLGTFANNDIKHIDPTGTDHELFSTGLKKSLYNYMHSYCLDHPLSNWFDFDVPETILAPDLILNYLENCPQRQFKKSHSVKWIGGVVTYNAEVEALVIHASQESFELPCTPDLGLWIVEFITQLSTDTIKFQELDQRFTNSFHSDFQDFVVSDFFDGLRQIGLLIL